MKRTKRILSLALVVVMIFALGASAMAATITIDTTEVGEYRGYRILDLTTSGTGTDGELNYSYSVGIKYAAILRSVLGLKADATDTAVIEAISNLSDARAFADAMYLAILAAGLGHDAITTTNVFTDVEQGYWLIADTTNNAGEDAVGSIVMLDTAGLNNLTVTPKKDLPTVDKEVQENSTGVWGETADYNIGDVVPFRLSSAVPAQAGSYTNGYTFIFHDTLSAGLTLNETSVAVTVGGSNYTSFTQTAPVNGYFTVTVTGLKAHPGEEVVISYNATLNQNAVIYTASNPNEVYLEFSNDPYGDGTGETVEVEVDVYTYRFEIYKYTGDLEAEEDEPLADAEFELYKDADFTQKINLSATNDPNTYVVDAAGSAVVKTDATGLVTIKGLDAGTYYLKETAAPDGFNPITDPIEVVITPATSGGTYVITRMNVLNQTGAELPGTGGIGTTIFYIVGGLLVCAAVVLLIIKTRKSKAAN